MLVLVVLVLLGEVPNPFEAKVPPLEKEMCQTTETDKTKRNIFRGGCLRGLQDEGKESTWHNNFAPFGFWFWP
jgi:hypothetical protein